MENIKFFIIDQLGMVIGEQDPESTDHKTKIMNPLLVEPTATRGNYALTSNPLFEDSMEVNSNYMVLTAAPKKALLEQYQSYITKKKTGIVTPKIELVSR